MLVKTLVAGNIAALIMVFIILTQPSCTISPISALEQPYPKNVTTEKILVMVIDTKVDYTHPFLKDYIDIKNSPNLDDTFDDDWTNEHGTHVTGLLIYGDSIHKHNPIGLCKNVQIVLCRMRKDLVLERAANIPECLRLAKKLGVKYVNISGGGLGYDEDEKKALEELAATGTVVVTAAGNENAMLELKHYYPASYDIQNMIVVANGKDKFHMNSKTNFGEKVVWENGDDILSTIPGGMFGYMSGTSQAAPLRLHKILMSRCDTEVHIPLPSRNDGEIIDLGRSYGRNQHN